MTDPREERVAAGLFTQLAGAQSLTDPEKARLIEVCLKAAHEIEARMVDVRRRLDAELDAKLEAELNAIVAQVIDRFGRDAGLEVFTDQWGTMHYRYPRLTEREDG